MARDREYISLINTVRWRRLRLSVLECEPLCRRCAEAGRVRQAREVHHVRPIQAGVTPWERERLAYDPANLMPLCTEYHQREHEHLGSKGKAEQTSRHKAETAEFRTKLPNVYCTDERKSWIPAKLAREMSRKIELTDIKGRPAATVSMGPFGAQ